MAGVAAAARPPTKKNLKRPPFRVIKPTLWRYLAPLTLGEQILWLRDLAADAEELRELLLSSRHVNAVRAEHDAAMWDAVLDTSRAIARAGSNGRAVLPVPGN
jgi:hypothetical protein